MLREVSCSKRHAFVHPSTSFEHCSRGSGCVYQDVPVTFKNGYYTATTRSRSDWLPAVSPRHSRHVQVTTGQASLTAAVPYRLSFHQLIPTLHLQLSPGA